MNINYSERICIKCSHYRPTYMTRLLSFDVGIKNLAYCILDLSQNDLNVVEWNILNLCDSQNNTAIQHHTCTEIQKNGKCCGKKAKYFKNNIYNCEKHAKNSKKYQLPKKEHSVASLKKMKMEQLREFRQRTLGILGISQECPTKKDDIIQELLRKFREMEWEVLSIPKKSNASKTDLITIGRELHRQLGNNPIMSTVTHVIIENQISPIANRMKTIQGMIAQHFIGLGVSNIEFVSSGNKLKDLAKQSDAKTNYKKNKQDGIFYCEKFLRENVKHESWMTVLRESNKKDDLADCFLQGLWWVNRGSPIPPPI